MRRATITTTHGDDAAERVAAALAPDNTAEMATRVEGDAVVTTVEREETSGLRSTVDDYVVNCRVADRLGGDGSTDSTNDTQDTDTNT
ncbi:KEOPS complex Pcc1-like subunit [Halosimplex carlsbadense 2-9-1]|uniref:KEOPS complex Pcc1-like subunit n=1 Tax=Halosimplex carlsbadense 2-9-1 TaxID=797114 RepID=M0CHR9_9EURY|nr:KEOPS complex subunit Pcc1 [Halosimplex carlsbadense]ELZ22781.1 KEOPS complex Pcc1-like subunit [Halosimplex carlsbadense 2-9-1]